MTGQNLIILYQKLRDTYGHQGWWPAEEWFEIIVGAILAQNVSWIGASKAVCALKRSGLLFPRSLLDAGTDTIADLIHSSRYYNQKTKKLLIFSEWFIKTYQGRESSICSQHTGELRRELLSLKGFGPETVDSILLYACKKPVFVVDAYTRRIGSRFGWFPEEITYEEMQNYFMNN